jgi:hypothetical protein
MSALPAVRCVWCAKDQPANANLALVGAAVQCEDKWWSVRRINEYGVGENEWLVEEVVDFVPSTTFVVEGEGDELDLLFTRNDDFGGGANGVFGGDEENDGAAARIDSKRAQVGVLEDATTRGRRATVTAGGALLTDASATTQPVSGTVAATLLKDHRVSAALSLRMTRRDALKGTDWSAAGRNWQAAGGRLEVDPTTPPGPDLRLAAAAGTLRFLTDGRPVGSLPLSLTAKDGARRVELPLVLDAEGARLGPVRLGPSPRLF